MRFSEKEVWGKFAASLGPQALRLGLGRPPPLGLAGGLGGAVPPLCPKKPPPNDFGGHSFAHWLPGCG